MKETELVHDENDRGERVLDVVEGRPEGGDDAVAGFRSCAILVAGAEAASTLSKEHMLASAIEFSLSKT